jgi:hypothetical protein
MQLLRSVQDWVVPALIWVVFAMLIWLLATGLLGPAY